MAQRKNAKTRPATVTTSRSGTHPPITVPPPQTEALACAFVAYSADMLLMLDSRGRPFYANPATEIILGYPMEALLHRDLLQIVHPEDRPSVEQMVAQVMQAPNASCTLRYRLCHHDGSYRWLDAHLRNLLHDPHVGAIIATYRENIAQKTTEVVGTAMAREESATHMRLESEMQAHARELEEVLETITDGVSLIDTTGHVRRINAAGRNMLGGVDDDTVTAFLALPTQERMQQLQMCDMQGHPIDLDAVPQHRIVQGETISGETVVDVQVHTLDGRQRIWNFSGAPIHASDGTVIGGVTAFRDVTERRQREEAIRRQAQEFESIIATVSDALFVYDSEGHLTRMNPAGQALLGLDEKHLHIEGNPTERAERWAFRDETGQAIPPEQLPLTRFLHGEQLTGETAVDLWIQPLHGHARLFSISGGPIWGADRSIIGAVSLAHDVTTRRQLEQRMHVSLNAVLEMAKAAVGAHGDMHATATNIALVICEVLGCSRVGIIAIEPETNIMHALTVVGLSAEEEAQWWAMQPMDAQYGDGADPDQLARFSAGEPLIIDMTQPPFDQQPNPFNVTVALYLPIQLDGRMVGILSLDYAGASHEYTTQEIALAQGIADLAALVMERERLSATNVEAQAREMTLAATNAQMLTFLGIAGHELRTPITSIKASIQMAARAVNATLASALEGPVATKLARAEKLLTNADRQTTKLNTLIEDLLNVTRIQAGKLDLRLDATDIVALVAETVDDQRHAWPNRTITLTAATSPLVLTLDADRIAQVVANYLTNALKYSAEDAPVDVIIDTDGTTARVAIRDHGPGIPEAEQAHLWELFHQVPGVVQQSGSGHGLGLGLYICQTIIDRHAGQVGVESAAGTGSTFWFTVPLMPNT